MLMILGASGHLTEGIQKEAMGDSEAPMESMVSTLISLIIEIFLIRMICEG